MKSLKRWLSVAVVTVASLVLVLAQGLPVAADERPEYRLQVAPSTLSLDLEPGETTTTKFRVQNTGTKPFKFVVDVAPYSVIDEAYNADYESLNKYTDLKKWVKFSRDDGEVQPGDQVEVTATIEVPKDVPAGGQYASIMVSMVDDDAADNEGVAITMTKRIGIVMYSTVEGNTRKEGKVVENKVASFLFKPPITATSLVENTGNVHANATYILQVFPLFSDEEVYSNEDNPERRTILPETKRYNEISWNDAPQLGVFKVRQTVRFLDKEEVTEKLVFLCPIWFLFIILLLIFGIIFWIVGRVRGRRA